MAAVTLRGLTKTFDGGARPALQELSLEVRDGEFLVLLGPSGCGKSTALRCIAGLEEPTTGEVLIGEREVTHLSPAERDVAMVFQNYALYPHLTARGNMAFGLEVRGVAEPEIARRVQETAQRLGLTELLDRRPAQLRSEEHTSELQSRSDLVCRLLLEKKNRHSTNNASMRHDSKDTAWMHLIK